jgi:NAD(P)-dependent dehydrogenase (short-subunit alcohol dehydrogenase family)
VFGKYSLRINRLFGRYLNDPTVLGHGDRRSKTLGRADDIAAAVAFLASDDADFITGADLVVDGAMSSTIAWNRAAHKIRSFDRLKETNA